MSSTITQTHLKQNILKALERFGNLSRDVLQEVGISIRVIRIDVIVNKSEKLDD